MVTFRAGWLLVALALCGCAVATIEPGRIQSIRRVAIVSAIGDRFTVKKIGITIFGNDQRDFPIDAWKIDDAVTDKVRAVVGKRFEVRPVTYQRSAFFVSENSGRTAADAARSQFAAQQDIDAYIVVTKGTSPYGDSNQYLTGLGIFEGGSLLMRTVSVHTMYWITVIDGHQFTVIGNVPAWTIDKSFMQGIHGPNREVDKSLWPDVLDAAANPKLKTVVLELLDQNLPGSVQSLKIME